MRAAVPFAFSILSTLVALTACTSTDLVNPNLQGSVSLTVLDANTSLPVDGVTLEVVGGSRMKTAGGGTATFDAVRAGNSFLLLSKDGYEASQEPMVVTTQGTEEIMAPNVAHTYRIHRLGGRVRGRVLVRPLDLPDTTTVVGAAGVTVQLRLAATGNGGQGTSYIMPLRTTTTTATGDYVFDSLPEVSTYSVEVPEFTVGGRKYSQASTSVNVGNLIAGGEYRQPNLILQVSGSRIIEVVPKSTRLVANQPWVFVFSQSIDTVRSHLNIPVGQTLVNFSTKAVGAPGQAYEYAAEWSENFTVLSIHPKYGTWITGATYGLQFYYQLVGWQNDYIPRFTELLSDPVQ